MKPIADLFLAQAERLVKDVKPMFAEQPPPVRAMALAELIAAHFAEIDLDQRSTARADFLRFVDEMVPEFEKQFQGGLPPDRRH